MHANKQLVNSEYVFPILKRNQYFFQKAIICFPSNCFFIYFFLFNLEIGQFIKPLNKKKREELFLLNIIFETSGFMGHIELIWRNLVQIYKMQFWCL